jgi:hypothetical protein
MVGQESEEMPGLVLVTLCNLRQGKAKVGFSLFLVNSEDLSEIMIEAEFIYYVSHFSGLFVLMLFVS